MSEVPRLPRARGPLSEWVVGALRRQADRAEPPEPDLSAADALADDDLQLALYACYELHYRGFAGVDPALEWDTDVLALRGRLERLFEAGLREAVPAEPVEPERVGETLFALVAGDEGPSVARYLETQGSVEELRELLIHRSAYQLKEADPHTWVIPRLAGAPKVALVEIQADEYGGGRPERLHSALFAQTMRELGLDDTYGAYLDRVPGSTLATVNLASWLGLHRRLRGALVGHLATYEIGSPGPSRRYANALRRLGFDAAATDFFDEHVIADSVHENVAAYDMAEGLARAEPQLAADVVWGGRVLLELDGRAAQRKLAAWDAGSSSLLAGEPALA